MMKIRPTWGLLICCDLGLRGLLAERGRGGREERGARETPSLYRGAREAPSLPTVLAGEEGGSDWEELCPESEWVWWEAWGGGVRDCINTLTHLNT